MVYSKAHVDGRLRPEIVWVVGVMFVLLRQQRRVSSLRKLAFLVDECEDVQRLGGNQLQSFFVVDELNVLPVDHFIVVLLLHTRHAAAIEMCGIPVSEKYCGIKSDSIICRGLANTVLSILRKSLHVDEISSRS